MLEELGSHSSTENEVVGSCENGRRRILDDCLDDEREVLRAEAVLAAKGKGEASGIEKGGEEGRLELTKNVFPALSSHDHSKVRQTYW